MGRKFPLVALLDGVALVAAGWAAVWAWQVVKAKRKQARKGTDVKRLVPLTKGIFLSIHSSLTPGNMWTP